MQFLGYLRVGVGSVLLALLVGCGSEEEEASAPDVVNKSPNDDRTYAAVTLDNGLKVLMVSDSETEKSAAALSVGVGAFSDPMDFQGMAHYLEHMLFMGSESFPEPDGYMNFAAENGGSSNAYTSSEITIIGAVSYAAFTTFDLNYTALLALLVGLSVIVPYIGAFLVTIPVMLVALFQFGLAGDFYWVVGLYMLIQVLDGNVLVPLLFSEAVDLHPVAIIIAVLVFGGLWGVWGVFFAIPLATLCNVLLTSWPRAATE